MDEIKEDQRLRYQRNPKEPLSFEYLAIICRSCIADCIIINIVISLRRLQTLALCYYLGDIFISSFNLIYPYQAKFADIEALESAFEGEIFLQNLPSIVTAHVIDPLNGERSLMCCSRGKTIVIAMLMMDEREVITANRSHNPFFKGSDQGYSLGCCCSISITASKGKTSPRLVLVVLLTFCNAPFP
ncbi:hypothetical protein DITRI_Ditri01bG0149500 [Diplodiscus trichospermus]